MVAGELWRGAANDLAPLSHRGESQAREAAELMRSNPPALIISSPMTRALQTAHVVSSVHAVPLQVRVELREWLPDTTYQWTSVEQVSAAHSEMLDSREPLSDPRFETLEAVRARATQVLDSYRTAPGVVLAVCHEVVIHALTGHQRTSHAQVRPLSRVTPSESAANPHSVVPLSPPA